MISLLRFPRLFLDSIFKPRAASAQASLLPSTTALEMTRVEPLEARIAPATLYVDSSYTLDVDQGADGLDAGDEVTWTGDNASVSGLIYGTDAFEFFSDALTASVSDDTIQIAEDVEVADVDFGDKDIHIRGDAIDLLGFNTGTGTLYFETVTPGSIGINGAAGDLQIDAADLSSLDVNFAGLVFGDSGTTGINVDTEGDLSFPGALTLNAPQPGAPISIGDSAPGNGVSPLRASGGLTINGSGSTTTLATSVVTEGTPITINDSLILAADVLLDTTDGGGATAGADISVTGSIESGVGDWFELALTAGTSGRAIFGGNIGANGASLGAFSVTAEEIIFQAGLVNIDTQGGVHPIGGFHSGDITLEATGGSALELTPNFTVNGGPGGVSVTATGIVQPAASMVVVSGPGKISLDGNGAAIDLEGLLSTESDDADAVSITDASALVLGSINAQGVTGAAVVITDIAGTVTQTGTTLIATRNLSIEAGGAVTLDSTGNVFLGLIGIKTTAGGVTVYGSGDLIIDEIEAAGEAVTLVANSDNFIDGGVIDGNGAGINVTAASLTVSGSLANDSAAYGLPASTGVDLDTEVGEVTANVTLAGDLRLRNSGALNVISATTTNGAISITTDSGTLTANLVVANGSGNDVELSTTTSGDILLDAVTAVSDAVTIDSAGAIEELFVDGAAEIGADSLSLKAVDGIGAAAQIELAVVTLSAEVTGAGPINLLDGAGGLAVTSATTEDGDITLVATSGALALTQVTAGTGGKIAASTTGSGLLSVGGITTTGEIVLISAGAIEEIGADVTTDISADTLTLRAQTGIGMTATLEVDAGTIAVASVNSTGGIFLTDVSGGVVVTSATTKNGDISLTAVSGVLEVATVTAGSAGDVYLETAGSGDIKLGSVTATGDLVSIISADAVVDDNDDAMNITAADALISAAGGAGIGDALETAIVRLEGDGGSGGLVLENSGALTIGGVDGSVDGLAATLSNIEITAAGITIEEAIETGGDVTLTSTGAVTETTGLIKAETLEITAVGGIALAGANEVSKLVANNSGAKSGITLLNESTALEVGDVENASGGGIAITQTGEGIITGEVRSQGGDITISASVILTLDAAGTVSSAPGAGGTLTLANNAVIDGTIEVGAGDITLQGGDGDLVVTSAVSSGTPLTLTATGNVIIEGEVRTTSTTADLTIIADSDGDGAGGVAVRGDGLLEAGGDLSVTGSDLIGSAGDLDAVLIESNGTTERLAAFGDVLLRVNDQAPVGAQIWLGGVVASLQAGSITFDDAVFLSSEDAQVVTSAAGSILFLGTVDGGGDLLVQTDFGVINFNAAVGSEEAVGALTAASAYTVTFGSSFDGTSLTIADVAGTVTFTGDVFATGSGTTISVTAAELIALGELNSGAGDLFIQTDSLEFNDEVGGAGSLTIVSLTEGLDIGLDEAGTLNLDSAEIALLADGFSEIIIGAADGSNTFVVGTVSFSDPVTLQAPEGGTLELFGQISGTDNASVTLEFAEILFDLSGPVAIATAGEAITVGGNVTLATDATVTSGDPSLSEAGADIFFKDTLNGAFEFTALAGTTGTITFDGADNAPGGASIGGAERLAAIILSGGTVDVRPQIFTTGAQTLTGVDGVTLYAGALSSSEDGAITINGDLTVLAGLRIFTSGVAGADIVFNGEVTAGAPIGSLQLNAGDDGEITFGGATSVASVEVINAAAVTVQDTLASAGNIRITADEVTFAGGAESISAPGQFILTAGADALDVLLGGSDGSDPGTATLHVSEDDLAALAGGFSLVEIRAVGSTAQLTVDPAGATFSSPTILRQVNGSSAVIVNGDLVGVDTASLTIISPAVTLNANVMTEGQTIALPKVVLGAGTDDVSIAATHLGAAGANITIAGSVTVTGAGEHNLTVDAGSGKADLPALGLKAAPLGAVVVTAEGGATLRGAYADSIAVTGDAAIYGVAYATTGLDGQSYNGNTTLFGSHKFTTMGGPVSFGGTIDSALGKKSSLAVDTRGGSISVDGEVGGIVELATISAKAGTGDVTFAADVTARTFTIAGTDITTESVTTMLGTQTYAGLGAVTINGSILARSLGLKGDTFVVNDVVTTTSQTYRGEGEFLGALTGKTLSITSTGAVESAEAWNFTGSALINAVGSDITIAEPSSGSHAFGSLQISGNDVQVVEGDSTLLRALRLTGSLDLVSGGDVTQLGSLKTTLLSVEAAGKIELNKGVNTIPELGVLTAGTGIFVINSTGDLTLTGDITSANGDIVIVANHLRSGEVYNGGGSLFAENGRWIIYARTEGISDDFGADTVVVTSQPYYQYTPPAEDGNVMVYRFPAPEEE